MLWGLTKQNHWLQNVDSLQPQEQQHLLLQQHQEGMGMSDKHLLNIDDPLAATGMIDPAAVAGGTSGGASVVVSRSSRGYGRGQMSSCATSSEGFGGAGGAGAANSLARASIASHATQLSYLPADAAHVECLMAQAEHDLAVKKQEVRLSITPGRQRLPSWAVLRLCLSDTICCKVQMVKLDLVFSSFTSPCSLSPLLHAGTAIPGEPQNPKAPSSPCPCKDGQDAS